MSLTVEQTRRIAAEVLERDHPALQVMRVKTEGGSGYAEAMVTVANCHAEPCRLSARTHCRPLQQDANGRV